MNTHLSDTSSVYDVFRFVYSFKGYLRTCIKNHEDDVDINKIKKIVKDFDSFLSLPFLNILKNVNIYRQNLYFMLKLFIVVNI